MHGLLPMLAIVATTVELLSYAAYVRDILIGRARPSRASWIVWAPLCWLTLASNWQAGADLTLIKLTAMCIGVTAVAALALRFGTGGWSRVDRLCFALTALGILLWLQTHDPVTALVLFIMADMSAAVPTIRDATLRPDKDSRAAWSLSLVAAALNLAVIQAEHWSATWAAFGVWGFNVYLVLLDLLVVGLMVRSSLAQALRRLGGLGSVPGGRPVIAPAALHKTTL
jgi:hypothetical protein